MNIQEIERSLYVGAIVRMSVAKRSHVVKPYYVEILKVSSDEIITNIPGEHKLSISKKNGNWEYQLSRMTIIGDKIKHGYLILNQKYLHK